jgi:hypothetical protein
VRLATAPSRFATARGRGPRAALLVCSALLGSSSACGALSGGRAISLAASSGPRPHLEVGVVEESDGASVRRRLDVYDVLPDGLSPRARLDALSLIGATGRGQVGSFRAYESGDSSRVHSGLVARGAGDVDEPSAGAPVLLATRSGYASAQSERLVGLDAAAAPRWQLPLPALSPVCGGKASVEVDAQASPSGRWICVARTATSAPEQPAAGEHRDAPRPDARCAASRVEVVLVDDGGTRRAVHAHDWNAGAAGHAQCAVRDDGAALLLLPWAVDGRTGSDARWLSTAGGSQPWTQLGGATVDAAPVGDRWAVLLHRQGERGASPWLIGAGARGQRLLASGEHALVPLGPTVVIVSVAMPDRGALDVRRFDARGRRLGEERISVD